MNYIWQIWTEQIFEWTILVGDFEFMNEHILYEDTIYLSVT